MLIEFRFRWKVFARKCKKYMNSFEVITSACINYDFIERSRMCIIAELLRAFKYEIILKQFKFVYISGLIIRICLLALYEGYFLNFWFYKS